FFIRFLLCCLIDVAEDGQQVMKLVLGQSGQGFHLTVVSDLQPHRLAPSMTFWRIAYLVIYWGTTLDYTSMSRSQLQCLCRGKTPRCPAIPQAAAACSYRASYGSGSGVTCRGPRSRQATTCGSGQNTALRPTAPCPQCHSPIA